MSENDNAIQKYEKQKPAKELKRAARALEVAEQETIESENDYKLAAARILFSKGERQTLIEQKDQYAVPAYRTWKEILAAYKPGIDKWTECIKTLETKMADRDRLLEAENKKREEERRVLAEKEAAEQKQELLEQAERASLRGDKETAEDLREEAEETMAVPVPVIASMPPKVEGLTAVKRWTFEVEDIEKVPDEWVTKTVIGAKVRAEAKRTNGRCKIPGIRVYQETGRAKA